MVGLVGRSAEIPAECAIGKKEDRVGYHRVQYVSRPHIPSLNTEREGDFPIGLRGGTQGGLFVGFAGWVCRGWMVIHAYGKYMVVCGGVLGAIRQDYS